MSDRWNNLLLALLLVGHLVLMSTDEGSRGSLLESTALAGLGPLVQAAQSSAETASAVAGSVRLGDSLREENRQLRREVEVLRRQLVRLHGVEEELERLSRLADYARFDSGRFFVADVVYLDRASWLRTLVIYTGAENAQKNQPVVTDRGLVGRIILSTERYAKVLLITDRAASASAMIRRTRRRGVVRGEGEGLVLENIPLLADVEMGDRVVTAGIDGIFPRGIPIGEVVSVDPGTGLFHRIEVAPAIDFGLLDQVYVLTEEVIPPEIRERFYGRDPEASP